ncbi:MAG: PPC domain-containing protein [Spirochaetia bacterium]|nr:PPC domain-containing protein [Spirochaetia bacterium]
MKNLKMKNILFSGLLFMAVSCGPAPLTSGDPVPGGNTMPVNYLSETATISFSSLAYTGMVDTTSSYYAVSGLTSGHNYTINLTALTDNVDLLVFPNSNFTGTGCASAQSGLTNESCSMTINATSVYIKVIGASTTAGAGFILAMVDNTTGGGGGGGYVNQGTSVAPTPIAFTGSPFTFSGTVLNGTGSYYALSGLTVGHSYTFTISGTPGSPYAMYYKDSGFVTYLGGLVAGFTYDYAVNSTMGIFVGGTSTGLTITVTDNGRKIDGYGSANPMTLAFGTADFPHSGVVTSTWSSFYKVTGLTVGHNYSVNVTGMTDNVELDVYNEPAFIWTWYCSSYNTATTNENCSFKLTPAAPIAYVLVKGIHTTAGATYTLNVIDNGALAVEGTASAAGAKAITLDGTSSYAGMVDNWSSSYYKINLTAGHLYTFTITSMTDNVDLYFYDGDGTFTRSVSINGLNHAPCQSIGSSTNGVFYKDSCSYVVTGGATPSYFEINGAGSSGGGLFTLNMRDMGLPLTPVNEGTAAAPKAVALGTMPYMGTVLNSSDSFYVITGLTSNTTYTITLTSLTDDADLYVYSDAFVTQTCASLASSWYLDYCSFTTPAAGTTAYIRVTPWTSFNISGRSQFQLSVQ